MSNDQIIILTILGITVVMFVWGKWRHDMVAAGALLACVLAGLVPTAHAFAGFGHPAVITVACVLILSRSLQTSGAVDALTRRLLPTTTGPMVSIAAIIALSTVLSAFMNNVGALALLMPVAIQIAKRHELPPGQVLMPVAFGSILGGMTTLIGTPPNLIVSGFRQQTKESGFAMFDFSPVGVVVAAVGVIFVVLFGRHLVPIRKQTGAEGFDTGAYLTEARVPEDSKAEGMTLRELEAALGKADAQVVGLVRNDVRLAAPNPARKVLGNDILVIEAEAEALSPALGKLGLKLEATEKGKEKEEATSADNKKKNNKKKDEDAKPALASETELVELAVLPGSPLVGRSASDLMLRTRYGINLLGVSRQGQHSRARLRSLRLKEGDLLMMHGPVAAITDFASNFNCVPLAAREVHIPDKGKLFLSVTIMLAAITGAAFGLLPAAISFAAGVLVSMALRTIPPRSVYEAVDWPVIVLLAALIPVAGAMEATGTAGMIAKFLLGTLAGGHVIFALVLILLVTMTLSDLMNNAATAAVMCPIAIGAASQLGANADTFLMAVAIGASCAFLTPIGHQNNTLILGPGGFRFGDYWRLGLPLQILVVVVAIPMLLIVWPL